MPVGHGLLGQVVVNNQRVHAVIHEPLAHRCASERREILVGGRVRGRGRDNDRVRHRTGLFEDRDHPGDG